MNKNIPVPTPPKAPNSDADVEIPNIPAPPSLNDDGAHKDASTSFIAGNGSNSELGNNLNIGKSINKIMFVGVGMLLVLGVVGAVVFWVYQGVDDLGVGERDYKNLVSNTIDSESGAGEGAGVDNNASCQKQYDKLLEVNGFDFETHCIDQSVRTGEYEDNKIPEKKKNIVLIFDASGSMAAQIDGKRKIDIAKEAVWKFIDQIDGEDNLALSIIVYGHKGSNNVSQKSISCAGIEEVYYLGNVDAEIAKAKLNAFDATGWTPIAGAFKKAEEILSKYQNDENFILLVSDGKEMCGGDPVGTMKALKEIGLNVKADVIGFDVGGVDEAQLKAIAEAGGVDYFSVSSAVDLENAFAKHKEMLNKANYKIGRTVEGLYDISFIVHTYGQCRTMLEKEKIAMMLDIYGNKLVSQGCSKSVEDGYMTRYNSIKNKLQSTYEQGYNIFVQSAKK